MKFTLCIDVDVPSATRQQQNMGYPKSAHALEWLGDQLRMAYAARSLEVMDRMAMMKGEKGSELDQAYIKAQKQIMKEIKKALVTVREHK